MKPVTIMLLLVTGAFFSCKKKTGNIIIEGQGDGSQFEIVRMDTFDLKTTSVLEDSLPGNGLPYSLIGMMNDPLLGKTSASVYAIAALNEPHADFPNTLMPDSAILYIPIVDGLNFYGDRSAKQLWKICPLISNIDGAKVYYQSSELEVDESLTSSYSGSIFSASYDSVKYKKGKMEMHPGIRVKLSMDMAKKLMQMPKTAYQSNDGLNISFKGLAIMPQDNDLPSGKGGIGVYDMVGDNALENSAVIMLYYSDTSTFVFKFSTSSRIVTKGKTGPYPIAVRDQLNHPEANYSKTWVQSLNGVKTMIILDDLYKIVQQGNVAINKAQIVLSIDKSSVDGSFFAPPRLNLFRPPSASSRRNYLLKDAGTTAFGGIYNEAAGTYTFNITRHVQEVLNSYKTEGKDINYGLFLSHPTAEPVLASRVAIDHSKTKLIITYTKLN